MALFGNENDNEHITMKQSEMSITKKICPYNDILPLIFLERSHDF